MKFDRPTNQLARMSADSSGCSAMYWLPSMVTAEIEFTKSGFEASRSSRAESTQHGWLIHSPAGGRSCDGSTSWAICDSVPIETNGCQAM